MIWPGQLQWDRVEVCIVIDFKWNWKILVKLKKSNEKRCPRFYSVSDAEISLGKEKGFEETFVQPLGYET